MDEELREKYHEAVQELKRIDHIIFVTLKYTRTAEVLKSIVERMISAFDYMLDLLLIYYQQKGELESIQKSPGLKCTQLKELTDDEKIIEMFDFYLLLRRVVRSEYDIINEYKRHVGMVFEMLDGRELIINIDYVTEKYHTMQDYLQYIKEYIFGVEEE